MDTHLQKTFEKIYRDNADALFRFILFRVSDRDIAIDLTEDSFVKFWQTLQKEKVAEPRALIFKIARNLVIDWYRKKKSISLQNFGGQEIEERKGIFLDMFASDIPGTDMESEARLVIEAIRGLEPIYREAVYLRFVEELSPKEIADTLGESANVISVRINRGVGLLKSKLHI